MEIQVAWVSVANRNNSVVWIVQISCNVRQIHSQKCDATECSETNQYAMRSIVGAFPIHCF
jgi:hypothetical protein